MEGKGAEKMKNADFLKKTFGKICSIRIFVLPLHPQMRNHFAVWRDSSAG